MMKSKKNGAPLSGQSSFLTWEVEMFCRGCICRKCLYCASGRCPYGVCYDDLRAVTAPYDAAHPGKPPRKAWSDWDKPGEQAHWCRGGVFYPANSCAKYVPYAASRVQECLGCMVQVFQDGYVQCPIIEQIGCKQCYEQFERKCENV